MKGARAYKDAKENDMIEPLSLHPEIDPVRCAGCGACVRACPEGEIIQMINHKAVLTAPTKCVGHGECEIACPFNAITLVFGFTAVAWFILGATVSVRTASQDGTLKREVGQLWGVPQRQRAPTVHRVAKAPEERPGARGRAASRTA